MSEEIKNIRRMAQRGLKAAQREERSNFVDIFQHILDAYDRLPKLEENELQEKRIGITAKVTQND